MFCIENNEKNKSVVILNPERSEWVSRSHVTSVESVVNDGAKTQCYSAKRDLYVDFAYAQPLKMTEKVLSFLRLRGASEKQKESSLILRKAKFQAIFKFVLSSASGGDGGGKYNRISAFVSMPVLLIRRSLEKFFKKNFRDDSLFCFGFAKVVALTLLFTLITTTESRADESATTAEDTTQTQETQKLLTKEGDCGVGCKYKITEESGKRNLYVYNNPNYTGIANIASYAFTSSYDNAGNHYNYYDNAKFDKITIDGDFDTIGRNAFYRNDASEVVFNGNIKNIGYAAFKYNNFTSVDLPEGLQSIEGEAFYHNSISSIVIPDSVKSIGNWGFAAQNIGTVFVSDNLDVLGANGNVYHPFEKNFSMICKGDVEKCQSLVKEYQLSDSSTTTDLSDRVTGVDKDHCTGEKYFWNGTSCSRKESYCDKDMYYSGYECRMRPTDGTEITCDYDISGWVKVGNNCYSPEVTYAKKHYTPAEANQWLRDGNDNFVVLTFKK